MTQAIPISQIVSVVPSVVSTGGSPLSLNLILVDSSVYAPMGSLLTFTTADDVSLYFGVGSTQAALAAIYFAGFEGATKLPSTLYVSGYAAADRAAWLRGTSLSGMTLTTLQAITGTLAVTVDGVAKTAASLNLSAASSFTNAASLITTALSLSGGAAVTWDAATSKFVVTSGTTGASSTMTLVTGTASAALGLSAGTLSQGTVADTPTTAMARIKVLSTNWATFTTTFVPTLSDKTLFAAWATAQSKRYLYIAHDLDSGYATSNNAAVFGTIVDVGNYDGVAVIYGSASHAVFLASIAASVDWDSINGRTTAAFRTQSGLATTVDTQALADSVLSNGASYYGLYASDSGDTYNIVYDGRMPGSVFQWFDSFVDQVFLNSQLRKGIFNGLLSVGSAPYNDVGYSFVRAWCADPIAQALNNGTIRVGIPLSSAQAAAVNSVAGLKIDGFLTANGYYLQILPATAETRGARTSPPIKLWYTDGGSIQAINLASIAVL